MYQNPISVSFLRAAVATKPGILGILFSVSVAFLSRAAVVTNPLVLGFLSQHLQFLFQDVALDQDIISRFFSKSYCVLETILLVLVIIVSKAFAFVTNLS